MMELQEIEVTIGKNGEVQVHVRGVKGKACLELTAALEAALGGQVTLREMTPEVDETEGLQNDLNLDIKN
jgi:DNA-binding transcriptional regulator YdaS (Cro superfamily)